eukprot:6177051-Pleurochrysis_carterae.AAC.2
MHLVNTSAMLCAVGTRVTDMAFLAMQSRMNGHRCWICFVFLNGVGSSDTAMAPLLSMKRVVGCVCLSPMSASRWHSLTGAQDRAVLFL